MIYLDNAATSMPKSKNVISAVVESLKTCGNSGRSGHPFALKASETVYLCRKRLAEMFNTRPEYVILTSGATQALNMAIKGTNRPGGVTVVSSMEHNAVMRPLNSLRKRGETVLRQFSVDVKSDSITLENFSAVSRSATNLVITHASNVCGRILPVKHLRLLSDESAIFILDASQTAGHFPIDIVELGVDIICVPAHKALGGPMGVGALIINPFSDVTIDCLVEGGTGTDSKSIEMPELYPERLEAGTANICGISGFSSALQNFVYPENEREVFSYLVKKINNEVDIITYGAPLDNFDDYVPVLLFNKQNYDCETLTSVLSDKGFALRGGFHCAPNAHQTLGTYEIGGVRLSLGRNNTKKEIDKFINALCEIK